MQSNSNPEKPLGYREIDRCQTLADGVIAIVMTLLVLGIQIPTDHQFSEQGLISFLRRIGYELFVYAVSFWLVATYWIQHAAILKHVRSGTRILVWLNLLFLLPVTLLPFVTRLKSIYREEPLVIVLFGGLQIAIGLCLILMWQYLLRHPALLARPVDPQLNQSMLRRMWISPVLISIAAIALSFVEVHLGTALFLSIPLYYMSHRLTDGETMA